MFKEDRKNLQFSIEKTVNTDFGIEVFVRAWNKGKKVGFGDGTVEIERFKIYNQPTLVSDDNGDIVRNILINDDTGEVAKRRFRHDPNEAIRQVIEHNLQVINIKDDTKIKEGKIGNTISTFYPAAGATSPVDGTTAYTGDASWATTHNAATATAVQDTSTSAIFIRSRDAGSQYQLYRGVMCFNTSTIGTDSISSATFSFAARGGADGDDDDGYTIEIVDLTLASTAAVTTGDYDAFGTTSYGSFDVSSWVNTDGTYNDWTLTDTSIINKSGVTELGLRMSGDINNTAPTGNNSIGGYFADDGGAGTTNDPKLVVEHASTGFAHSKVMIIA